MIESLKVFLSRVFNFFSDHEVYVDANTQSNHAGGNQQHIYQGTVIQAQVVQFSNAGAAAANSAGSTLNANQIIALEKLLEAVVPLCKVLGEDKSKAYFAGKLCQISNVDNWHNMPANMYDRAVRYLMKCAGFVAVES